MQVDGWLFKSMPWWPTPPHLENFLDSSKRSGTDQTSRRSSGYQSTQTKSASSEHTHSLPYRHIGGKNAKPVVDVELITIQGEPLPFLVPGIVDSGADVTVLPFGLAEQLGIGPNLLRVDEPTHTVSGPIDCRRYLKGIEAFVLGTRIRLDGTFVGAPDKEAFDGHLLLGRRDFFRYFRIAFDHIDNVPLMELTATATG